MAARNSQIAQAYTMIDRTVQAMTADRQDQLSYYKTLFDFYTSQKDDAGKALVTITNDEKAFLNAQIGLLEADMKLTQNNAENLKSAMTDPNTALLYGEAGVTLNDSPVQIAQKLATAAYAKEVADTSNKMALDGASYLAPGQKAPAGAQVLTTTDSKGVQKQWYVPVKATTGTIPPHPIPNLFTKAQVADMQGGGLQVDIATAIYQDIQSGMTLEDIRKTLRDYSIKKILAQPKTTTTTGFK